MKRFIRIILWALVLLWCGVIFYMSNQTAPESSELSGTLIWRLCERFYANFNSMTEIDKYFLVDSLQDVVRTIAHICEYGVLGILVRLAFIPHKVKSKMIISVILCLVYSISDEIHQFFVEGRAYQFSDVVCDTFGSLLGILLISLICKICLKKRIKKSKKHLQFE